MRGSRIARSALASVIVLGACAPAGVPRQPHPPPPTSAMTTTSPPARPLPAPDPHFVRAYAETRGFRLGAPNAVTPTPDGKSVLFLRAPARDPRQSLWELDMATGQEREVLTPDALARGPETLSAEERARRERARVATAGFTSFELSKDGARVLVSLGGRPWVLTRATGAFRGLPVGKGAVVDPRFSPDGTRVAYVRDHDLYMIGTESGAEAAITRGGTADQTRGLAEFVAQEELARSRGYWWSPDGARVLYEAADTTHVERLTLADVAHPERAPERVPYPRPGHANADVRMGIVSSQGGATTWVEWDREAFPYVGTVTWAEGAPPLLYVLDRLQRRGLLLAVDPQTGKTREVLRENDDAWLNLDPSVPRVLPGGAGVLWSSERGGAYQLYVASLDGGALRPITDLALGYRGLLGVSSDHAWAYVAGGPEPQESHVYAVALDGHAPPRRLDPAESEVTTAVFHGGSDVYAASEASTRALPHYVARDAKTGKSYPIASHAETPPFVPRPEILRVGPGQTRVAVLLPRNYQPGVKYPVIDAAYGGPGHRQVPASAFSYLLAQHIADATASIVVAIDAQGTPNRGRTWERPLVRKFADLPLEGHVATLQALLASRPDMDADRVGVYGWSFGGYFAALAVLRRPDVFKVGVAGAPVSEWRDYDTTYTERYLGLPDEPGDVYARSSLLPYAERPPTPDAPARPLLVIHGTADDNVFFTHALKLADALSRGGRPYELMPLMGVTHMPIDPTLAEAMWGRVTDFLARSLAR